MKPGPDNDYWDFVDVIPDKEARRGFYVGFLPTWGSYVTSSARPRDLHLDGVEPLLLPALQVLGSLVGVEPGEELPAGVRMIEKRMTLLRGEGPSVGADLERENGLSRGGEREQGGAQKHCVFHGDDAFKCQAPRQAREGVGRAEARASYLCGDNRWQIRHRDELGGVYN